MSTPQHQPYEQPLPHSPRRSIWRWLLPVLTGVAGLLLGILVMVPAAVGSSEPATPLGAADECGLGDRHSVGLDNGSRSSDFLIHWVPSDMSSRYSADVGEADVRCILEGMGAGSGDVATLMDSSADEASAIIGGREVARDVDDLSWTIRVHHAS